MKRSMLVLVGLGMGAFAGCSVEGAGLGGANGGATSTGGATWTGGARSGGASGQATGGNSGDDAATTLANARSSDGMAGGGGAGGMGGGAGGAAGQDSTSATGGTAGAGGAGGSGGVASRDGGPATGGGPGMGGSTGTGGQTGLDGSAGQGGSDVADVPAIEASLDLPLDNASDHGDGDVERADGPRDARDARDARDVRDVRDGRDGGDAASIDGGPTLNLVWSDEFEGAANTGVDVGNWNYITWDVGEVNNEKQQYTSSLSNVFHDGDGNLVLRARYAPSGTAPYTSGRIDTKGKVAFGPGHRIEVRAILPKGIGSFPAIIMMGSSGTWPACGQLSLTEQYGQDKSWFYSAVYAGTAAGTGSTDKTKYSFSDADTASAEFHVYSLDWYGDRVVFQVDGNQILTSNYGASSPLYTITEYIILDVALGGDMGGAIDNTAFPMDMVVDYVRVYQL